VNVDVGCVIGRRKRVDSIRVVLLVVVRELIPFVHGSPLVRSGN